MLFPPAAFVAIGAALWATDSLFRSQLVGHYSAFLLVFITQFICSFIILPLCWSRRQQIAKLSRRDWFAFLYLAIASNLLAMVAFTYAFSLTSNYTIPVLVQKLQPLIAVASAIFFLKEKLPKYYVLYAGIALAGSVLMSIDFAQNFSAHLNDFIAIGFALLAAAIWGVGTTVGRYVSLRHDFLFVTSVRYGLSALVIFCLAPLWAAEFIEKAPLIPGDLVNFLLMALVPGLIALFIYYKGMQSARASVACWLELAYPICAIIINWVLLGSALSAAQLTGAAMLLISMTLMARNR